MQAGETDEEEGMKQQQRMKTMTDWMRPMKAKGGLTRTTVGGSVNCWLLIAKEAKNHPAWRVHCRDGRVGCRK